MISRKRIFLSVNIVFQPEPASNLHAQRHARFIVLVDTIGSTFLQQNIC